mgnify:CR=1 FL=1
MKRLVTVIMLLALAVGAPLYAAIPSTMSYQGVLTDNGGNLVADGNYNFVFSIYSTPVAGAVLWTETQNTIPLTRGGFNVILGSVTPLNLAFDVQYYLGISVNGGPELSPRVTLASSPYALALRLPFSGTATSAGAALSIANAGAGPDVAANHRLDVGSTTTDGTLNWYRTGGAGNAGRLAGDSGGGNLYLFDELGAPYFDVESSIFGAGAFMALSSGTGAVYMDGNADGLGNPSLPLLGSNEIVFNSGAAPENSVSLPAGSISANEIFDEPGVAQGHVVGGVTVPDWPLGNGIMTDIVTVTITTPSDGYIVVAADAWNGLVGPATTSLTNYNFAEVQIDETAGGVADAAHSIRSGFSSASQNLHTFSSIALSRTYFKAAGTYTFRLEADAFFSDISMANSIYNPTIRATYFPTSYGTITTAVSAAEASQFENVRPIASTPSISPGPAVVSDAFQVDLRELELKAARAKADAELAQRRVLEARLARQRQHSAALRQPVTK